MTTLVDAINFVSHNCKYIGNRIIDNYNYFLYEVEDPRVKNWYIISSPLPTLLIIIIYLTIIKILPTFMNNRKPFNLTYVIRLYNILQIISCSVLVYQLVTPLSKPCYVWKCEYFRYSTIDPLSLKRLSLTYYFYFIKLSELFETVFFMLRKKFNQVTTLHVYHHLTTLTMAWYFCKYFAGGLVSFCMMLNSSIHILMYAYYFLSSLGPKWQKSIAKWKSTLTMLQMLQLFTLIAHSSQVLYNKNCGMPPITFFVYAPNVALIFYMFRNFYNKTYGRKTTKVT